MVKCPRCKSKMNLGAIGDRLIFYECGDCGIVHSPRLVVLWDDDYEKEIKKKNE